MAEARLFGSKEKKPRAATMTPRSPGALFRAFQKPNYDLPYSDWEFPRKEVKAGGFFLGNPKPSNEMMQFISVIRTRAEHIARFKLTYKFGGDHPSEGGMDCSGTMQFMLSDIGFDDMPRTSYQQYDWLKKNRTLNHSKSIPEKMGGRKGIKPGDLIFWGGTYDSGHKVSHVMIYLGQSGDGKHYMFGARGKKKKGLFGSGVDIFELSSGYQKSLVGYGTLPGVS
ncbi:MAG: NlpC/P60 family protein [Verrucomicrobiales bacterium]|nr:NlpC/P60 family protein [Verrucomicrobiales bacterium]